MRVGKGPWARAFAAAVALEENTPTAAVESLRLEPGLVTAHLDGCAVTISAATVPPRIWAAMTSYARNRGALEQAVKGEMQSVQLEHLMTQDWDEPLVPRPDAILRTCTCDGGGTCEHVAAVGACGRRRDRPRPGARSCAGAAVSTQQRRRKTTRGQAASRRCSRPAQAVRCSRCCTASARAGSRSAVKISSRCWGRRMRRSLKYGTAELSR